jgi:archaellum component FlaC
LAEQSLHRGLQLRLEALAQRIATLRQKMSVAKGTTKIEEFGDVEELERRHAMLAQRLEALNREGPGFRQDIKAEIEKMTDDLTGSVGEFVSWVDAGARGRRPLLDVWKL